MNLTTNPTFQTTFKTITYENKTFTDDADIANTFNWDFTSVSEKYVNKEKIPSPNLKKLEAFISTKLPKGNIFNIPYITEDFIYTFVTSLDNNKATGIDNISSRIVKISAPLITKQLTDICNHVSVTAVFRESGERQELQHFARETQPTTQKTTDLYLFCPFCLKFLKNMYTTHSTNFFW